LNLRPKVSKISQQSKISHKKRRFLYIFISIFVFRGCAKFHQNEKIKYKKEYSITIFHFFYERMLQNFEGKKKKKKYFCQNLDSVFSLVSFLKLVF